MKKRTDGHPVVRELHCMSVEGLKVQFWLEFYKAFIKIEGTMSTLEWSQGRGGKTSGWLEQISLLTRNLRSTNQASDQIIT